MLLSPVWNAYGAQGRANHRTALPPRPVVVTNRSGPLGRRAEADDVEGAINAASTGLDENTDHIVGSTLTNDSHRLVIDEYLAPIFGNPSDDRAVVNVAIEGEVEDTRGGMGNSDDVTWIHQCGRASFDAGEHLLGERGASCPLGGEQAVTQ